MQSIASISPTLHRPSDTPAAKDQNHAATEPPPEEFRDCLIKHRRRIKNTFAKDRPELIAQLLRQEKSKQLTALLAIVITARAPLLANFSFPVQQCLHQLDFASSWAPPRAVRANNDSPLPIFSHLCKSASISDSCIPFVSLCLGGEKTTPP